MNDGFIMKKRIKVFLQFILLFVLLSQNIQAISSFSNLSEEKSTIDEKIKIQKTVYYQRTIFHQTYLFFLLSQILLE